MGLCVTVLCGILAKQGDGRGMAISGATERLGGASIGGAWSTAMGIWPSTRDLGAKESGSRSIFIDMRYIYILYIIYIYSFVNR